MLFMKNTKKKKHPLIIAMAGGLAVYGAYSMVSSLKRGITDKMSCMINKMKKMKKKEEICSPSCDCDEDSYPTDY